MNKKLIMVRGLSGSGESTVANFFNGEVCTADDYLIINGKYVWTPELAAAAHIKCQTKCMMLMKKSISIIVVANTSTTEKELQVYYDIAKQYEYEVYSIIVENRHKGKSIHDVPEVTLEKMHNRFNIKLI